MQRFVQLALDLFGGPAAAPAPAPVQPAASGPALSLSDACQPTTWHHPRANRLVRLRGSEVAYEFQRGKRRTIGLSVGIEGLSVRAPRWTTLAEVDATLHEKAGWVLARLAESRERAGQLAQARTPWADGVVIQLLGEPLRVVLDPAHGFTQKGAVFEPGADGTAATLRLGLAHSAGAAQIRDAAQAWLMKHASAVFAERLDHFAPVVGVRWTRLRLSSAGTRWGSASADGSIRLNWRLIHLSMDMIDYVVVHELSHLRHMDHSPQFWDVVASVLPDHRQRRSALKSAALPLDA